MVVVTYQREIEVVFDYSESTTAAQSDQDAPCPSGTWVPLDQWLEEMS